MVRQKARLEERVRLLKLRLQEFEGTLRGLPEGHPHRPATEIGLSHIRKSITDAGRERNRLDIW